MPPNLMCIPAPWRRMLVSLFCVCSFVAGLAGVSWGQTGGDSEPEIADSTPNFHLPRLVCVLLACEIHRRPIRPPTSRGCPMVRCLNPR